MDWLGRMNKAIDFIENRQMLLRDMDQGYRSLIRKNRPHVSGRTVLMYPEEPSPCITEEPSPCITHVYYCDGCQKL